MTHLIDYLRDAGKKPAAFAKELGVAPSTVTRIIKGERKPSFELSKRISGITGIPVEALRPDIFDIGEPSSNADASPEAA